ncbi:hypothetical protein CR513_45075, partial [Mucuna pruriens]
MDSIACYDIESKIFNSRQGTLLVTKYYGTLNGLWIELDEYQGLKMCKANSIAYTRLIERGRIFKFLHGLNSEYDPIRVQILGKEKLPSLFEDIQAFSKEEMNHLRALLNSTSKSLGSCGLTMKVSKEKLITVSNGDHELTTRRMIGVAKEEDWLYYLQHTK